MSKIEQRDQNIMIINQVSCRLSEDPRLRFVVSGSYSIEVLTHQDGIVHNDIDSDVFTEDLPIAIAAIPSLLSQQNILGMDFSLYKLTSDRIEYDVQTNVENADCPKSRLEIHVIGAESVEGASIILRDSRSQRLSRVDLVESKLVDSKGNSSIIIVKSLAYSVASWALRISDAAQNQLRPVRQSDIDNFLLLLKQKVNIVEVLIAMENHPQMPRGVNAQDIYQSALIKVGRI